MARPVDLWEGGKVSKQIDAATARENGYVLLELGEDWVPYLFTERDRESDSVVHQTYRDTYLALAREDFPDNHHGNRARDDKYLELYGIMPTLSVLRERYRKIAAAQCTSELTYDALKALNEIVPYGDSDKAQRDARWFRAVEARVQGFMRAQKVETAEAIDAERLQNKDRAALNDYRKRVAAYRAVGEAQKRLDCEGFFKGKGSFVKGALDRPTHDALAEFERRNRIFGWGFLGQSTTELLRSTPIETERASVLRVLGERAVHAAGVIEDGSTSMKGNGKPRTFKGADGQQHPIPNLEAELREKMIAALGLQTTESTLAFLNAIGELKPGVSKIVAFKGPKLPEYYSGDMELSVVVDRGDVWYEFPYDERGKERTQSVTRRPQTTIFTEYLGEKIPIARYGTTIGGWRSDYVGDTVMWKYKGSPVGSRVWTQIVAGPVWLPPDSTPPKSLLVRVPTGKKGEKQYAINYHETGPSYASAYGLVAAYHRKYRRGEDGQLQIGGDEGIRMHGSVDYMSIMRRHSHGCHRLHNHLAVRLMSFVLEHRPHRRLGEQAIGFRRNIQYEDKTYLMELNEGGYVFELTRPIYVNVLEGTIRGDLKTPIETALPKYDDKIGAYVMPDGQAVAINRFGKMTPIAMPTPPAGATPASPSLLTGTMPGAVSTAVSGAALGAARGPAGAAGTAKPGIQQAGAPTSTPSKAVPAARPGTTAPPRPGATAPPRTGATAPPRPGTSTPGAR